MRWRIGNCIFDKTTRQVSGRVKTHLNYRQGRLLEFLIENYGQPYKDKEMIRAVWEGQSAEGSLHKYIAVLRDALGGERKSYIDTDPYRMIVEPKLLDDDELTNDRGTLFNDSDAPKRSQTKEPATNLSPKLDTERNPISDGSYKLEYRSAACDTKKSIGTRTDTPVVFEKPSPFTSGFLLSLDNMTVNLVSDLLFEDGPPGIILHQCRRSYRRSLEDFAYAVVYGTRVATGRNFRKSASDQIDRRIALIDQLGPLWEHQKFDESLKDGAALRDPRCQREIRNDLTLLDKSIQSCEWPFREWALYSAYRHLGDDESLQDNELPPGEYKYDVRTLPYYRESSFERAIAPLAVDLLSGYAREGILKDPKMPSDNAIRHFVRGGVMNLVAVMHEYRISCSDLGLFRIPHVLRCVIQETAESYNKTKHQQHLRNLVVQHVLATAFLEVSTIDKRSLVTVLIKLRETSPFSTIRHILENAGLILAHPSEGNEKAAERLYRDIKSKIDPLIILNEHFGVHQQAILHQMRSSEERAALREIGNISATEYEPKQLFHLFPELNPLWKAPMD